jgi:hypothetical protein
MRGRKSGRYATVSPKPYVSENKRVGIHREIDDEVASRAKPRTVKRPKADSMRARLP